MMIIYGRQPIMEALRSEHDVQRIYMAAGASGRTMHSILKLAERQHVAVERLQKDKIQSLVGAVVHQSIAAEVSMQKFKSQNHLAYLTALAHCKILILDQIQDPHNLGAILRTADIAGIDGIILPDKGTAKLNATVAKTSAGALFHCPVYHVDNLLTVMDQLKAQDVILTAATSGATRSLYDMDFSGKTALIIGAEGKGVRKNIAAQCHERIYIPQYGKIQSLNASVAAAVIMYEMVRQTRHLTSP
ncbi:MAG: 23S rRNA (guanosine(2251)-2'-O)-methyltransferase RlmB [Caldithrix sp.]|nr:23S rRNA (guanosine(2251)-2'-O)-methyltransferase RlmB [Caldithrix sp.]